MSKQSQWPSTSPVPPGQGVLSVSDVPSPQERGRAVSNHTWSFCHPNCIWLTRFKPNTTLSNIVQVLRACVRGKEDQSSDDLSELAAQKAVAFPQFSGQQLADKCKGVRSESRQGSNFCGFYYNITLSGADEVVTCQWRGKDTKDCTRACNNTSFRCLLGKQLLQTVGCCIITSGGRFPSWRHFFMCDYCSAGYSS